MMHSTSRLIRFIVFSLLLFALYHSITYCQDQSYFQKFLKNHYISWSDFPPIYAETLRSKDWNGLQRGVFDYEHTFLSSANTSNKIPPTIHFIWFHNLYESHPEVTNIPSIGSHAPRLCAEHNPTYEIKVWNATTSQELLEAHYSWFLPTYNSYKYPIQRIDAIKYFVLWHFGGVYMDMDIACRRSLDPLLDFPAWFPEASPLGVNNDLMASRAKHPVIKLMLDNLKARNKNLMFPYLTIFWSTGPQFTGDMLKKWSLDDQNNQYVQGTSKKNPDASSWFVLPQAFYSEEYTFFGHSPGGTWHGDDVAVVLWFVSHPVTFWILVALAFGGCCTLPLMYKRWTRRLWTDIQVGSIEIKE